MELDARNAATKEFNLALRSLRVLTDHLEDKSKPVMAGMPVATAIGERTREAVRHVMFGMRVAGLVIEAEPTVIETEAPDGRTAVREDLEDDAGMDAPEYPEGNPGAPNSGGDAPEGPDDAPGRNHGPSDEPDEPAPETVPA